MKTSESVHTGLVPLPIKKLTPGDSISLDVKIELVTGDLGLEACRIIDFGFPSAYNHEQQEAFRPMVNEVRSALKSCLEELSNGQKPKTISLKAVINKIFSGITKKERY